MVYISGSVLLVPLLGSKRVGIMRRWPSATLCQGRQPHGS